VQKGDTLADKLSRMFEVICKGCHRPLVTVERIRDPEIAMVTDHLQACAPSEPLGDAPMLGEIMRRVRVAVMDRAWQTPDA